jgi:hypothetical protein
VQRHPDPALLAREQVARVEAHAAVRALERIAAGARHATPGRGRDPHGERAAHRLARGGELVGEHARELSTVGQVVEVAGPASASALITVSSNPLPIPTADSTYSPARARPARARRPSRL